MRVAIHHTLEELKTLEATADRPALVLKFRCISLARKGWMAKQIAEALDRSPRTIQQWVGDYNREQINGLKDQRGGNHRFLTHEQEVRLKTLIEQRQADQESGIRFAREIIPLIEEHFNVTYSLSGIYELLHRLGYSWLMPRPTHEKNDPEAVEGFKKKL